MVSGVTVWATLDAARPCCMQCYRPAVGCAWLNAVVYCALLVVPCCRWMGKGVSKAVDHLNKEIAPALVVSNSGT